MDGHSKQAGVVPGNATRFRPRLVRIKVGITASARPREESMGKESLKNDFVNMYELSLELHIKDG